MEIKEIPSSELFFVWNEVALNTKPLKAGSVTFLPSGIDSGSLIGFGGIVGDADEERAVDDLRVMDAKQSALNPTISAKENPAGATTSSAVVDILLQAKPAARHDHMTAVVDSTLFIFGGQTNYELMRQDMHCIRKAGKEVREFDSLPQNHLLTLRAVEGRCSRTGWNNPACAGKWNTDCLLTSSRLCLDFVTWKRQCNFLKLSSMGADFVWRLCRLENSARI